MQEITKTLTLSTPVTVGKQEFTELQFVKPKARHFRGVTDDFELASNLAMVPLDVILEIGDPRDLAAVLAVTKDLSEPFAQALGSSSQKQSSRA